MFMLLTLLSPRVPGGILVIVEGVGVEVRGGVGVGGGGVWANG